MLFEIRFIKLDGYVRWSSTWHRAVWWLPHDRLAARYLPRPNASQTYRQAPSRGLLRETEECTRCLVRLGVRTTCRMCCRFGSLNFCIVNYLTSSLRYEWPQSNNHLKKKWHKIVKKQQPLEVMSECQRSSHVIAIASLKPTSFTKRFMKLRIFSWEFIHWSGNTVVQIIRSTSFDASLIQFVT